MNARTFIRKRDMVAECDAQVTKLFALVANRFGDENGRPIPQKILTCGDPKKGWHLLFNPTPHEIDDLDPCTAKVSYNGLTLGIIGPFGSVLLLNVRERDELIDWLDEDTRGF